MEGKVRDELRSDENKRTISPFWTVVRDEISGKNVREAQSCAGLGVNVQKTSGISFSYARVCSSRVLNPSCDVLASLCAPYLVMICTDE